MATTQRYYLSNSWIRLGFRAFSLFYFAICALAAPRLGLSENIFNLLIVAGFLILADWKMPIFAILERHRILKSDLSFLHETLFSHATNLFYQHRLSKFHDGNYVYVIKDASVSGYYKIGKTHLPSQRMTRFSVTLPFRIEILTIISCEDMSELESWLHQSFAKYRVDGEWFDLPAAALYEIMKMDTNFQTGRIYCEALAHDKSMKG